MNTLLDHTDQQTTAATQSSPEISLGTGTILGIFFALAVLCAVFFGFGYALGVKRPSPAPIVAAAPAPNFNSFKPPPGSPIPAATKPLETVVVPAPASDPVPAPQPDPTPVHTVIATHPAATAPPAPTPAPAATASSPTPFIVQIAAVSHGEDADLIASTLKRRGYAVLIRHEPQDALLHIQLGPFPTKKDAEAMRQRLQADGFNAYIK